jgi:flagellar biosynthesis chaperone FliJ
MWFFDEASEMQEYQSVKEKFSSLEKEYLELRVMLKNSQEGLGADPQNERFQAQVRHLEKRIKNLEEQYPWLTWETPVEVALFTPPHG